MPSSPIHVKTVIIGAGPAGMAAAMELLKADEEFCLVEKQNGVGGLARTYVIREGDLEFRTDNGPHRFFSKNPYLYEFIGSLLDEKWIKVRRQTRQFIDGVFIDYPVNARQVVQKLGLWTVVRILLDYVVAIIRYRIFKRPVRTFRDFAYANFGKTLAEFNIINYTEKIWGVSTDSLHRDWASQRVAGLNIRSVLMNMMRRALHGDRPGGPKSLVDEFWYPEDGTGLIYETIQQRIVASGRDVRLGTVPTSVRHDGARIISVSLSDGTEIALDNLIESIHIVDFLKLMDPLPPVAVRDAASKLRYRNQVHLFLTLDKERVTHDQWIYFPSREIPFARSSEMKNFSARMSPPDKTSLFIEFFCFEHDPEWRMSAEELLALALPHLESAGLCTRKDIRKVLQIRGRKGLSVVRHQLP